jgi:hypothetical protein
MKPVRGYRREAEELRGRVQELEGALKQIAAYSDLNAWEASDLKRNIARDALGMARDE